MFLGIGTGRMDRLLAHARQCGVTPPVDGRSAHPSREDDKSPEWFDADSWFCWAYHNIAELSYVEVYGIVLRILKTMASFLELSSGC